MASCNIRNYGNLTHIAHASAPLQMDYVFLLPKVVNSIMATITEEAVSTASVVVGEATVGSDLLEVVAVVLALAHQVQVLASFLPCSSAAQCPHGKN